MGELLDRDLQREILQRLAAGYPDPVEVSDFGQQTDQRLRVNLAYLNEHDLIQVNWFGAIGQGRRPSTARITAKGLDFLADDGGLSAVLGVLTVRLHDDTIKDLLVAKVMEAEGDEDAKQKLVDAIRSLPADATKTVAMHAIHSGIGQLPAAIASIRAFVGL